MSIFIQERRNYGFRWIKNIRLPLADDAHFVFKKVSNIIYCIITNDYVKAADFFHNRLNQNTVVPAPMILETEKDLFDLFHQNTAQELSKHLVGFFDESDFSDGSDVKPFKTEEPVETLKCKCYYCQIDLYASQYYKWDSSKYEVHTSCQKCGRRDSVLLTKEQIKQCNAQGGYQMSMG